MYEELTSRIRYHVKKAEFYGLKEHEATKLLAEAADAIEDLDNRLNLHRQGKIRHWIPVTERLPEESGHYLVAVEGNVLEAYYGKDWGSKPWTDPVEMYMTYYPTHWMPLPGPPKDGAE